MPPKGSKPRKAKRFSPQRSKKLSPRALFALRMSHADLLQPIHAETTGQAVLGHAAAVVIVCGCANTSPLNLPRTLAELGVNGTSFQSCVFNGVQGAGYRIQLDDIPNSPTTTLISVVNAIENAPKAQP